MRRAWAVGAVAAGALSLAAVTGVVVWATGVGLAATAAGCGSGTPRLTVHGTGTAAGTPDLLTLDFGVNVVAPDAHAALADDGTHTTSVLAALASGGVPAKDLQTTDLSVQPDYAPTGVLTGYSVTENVVAKLRDFATAGSLIDAAATAGGNSVRIDSLTYSLADPRRLEDRARQDAVRQAVSHAGAMAAAAGERLGPVCSLTDNTALAPEPLPGFASADERSSSGVPLQPGTQQATAQVTVVYALSTA